MKHPAALASITLTLAISAVAAGQHTEVLQKLNNDPAQKVSEDSKSYRVLFDAFLDMSPPPGGYTDAFDLNEIHPKMDEWSVVSDWAESSPQMAEAIIKCKKRKVIGLPYGKPGLPPGYVEKGLYAEIGVDNDLRRLDFRYTEAMDLIAAYTTAECYRRLEAGQVQEAIDLAMAEVYVLRQLCDRIFLDEKLHANQLLIDFLSVVRDLMYVYRDSISSSQFGDRKSDGISWDLHFLRTDLLEMPRGDRVVAEALLNLVFNQRGEADTQKFIDTFTDLQSAESPLTRFGAAKRWEMVSDIHASRDASFERLKLVYDDWLRRWDVRAYHFILSLKTEYARTNPVRYAAVAYSMRDIEGVFESRRHVISASNATAMAAGLNAYYHQFGKYPNDLEKIYATYVLKRFDLDAFNREWKGFGYLDQTNTPYPVSTVDGYMDLRGGLLYSVGQDHNSDRARRHTIDGAEGDLIYWPPIRAIVRGYEKPNG